MVAAGAAAALVSGCAGHWSTLDPAGPGAAGIATLWWVMLAGSGVLFVLVMGLFLLTLFRPGFGSRLSPIGWVVAGGLLMPIPVLTALLVVSLWQGEAILRADPGGEPLAVVATGRMWQWEFSYPDHPEVEPTFDILHLPVNRRIEVYALSEDVIHSFWVPRLGGKIDAIPGRENRFPLLAEETGTFGGICAEYCGVGHAEMLFDVVVHTSEDFEAMLQEAAAEAAP